MKNKRKYTSYILFCMENRPLLKNKFPEMNPRDVTKELGKKWNSLSITEKLSYKNKEEKKKENKTEESDECPYLCFLFYIYYVLGLTVIYGMFFYTKDTPNINQRISNMLPSPYDNIYPIPLPSPQDNYLFYRIFNILKSFFR